MLSQKWVFLDKISGQIIRLNSLKNVFLVRTNLLQFSVFGREYVEGVRIPPPVHHKGRERMLPEICSHAPFETLSS